MEFSRFLTEKGIINVLVLQLTCYVVCSLCGVDGLLLRSCALVLHCSYARAFGSLYTNRPSTEHLQASCLTSDVKKDPLGAVTRLSAY